MGIAERTKTLENYWKGHSQVQPLWCLSISGFLLKWFIVCLAQQNDVSRHLLQKTDQTLPRFQTPKYGRGVSGSWCEGNLVSATGHRLALMAASLHHRAPWHQNIQTAPASSLGFPTGLWWVALNRATEGPWLCWSKRKIKDSLNDKNDWNWGISCTRGPPVACIGPHPAKKKRGERVRLYGFTTDYAPTTWDPTASVVARRGGNQPATLVDLTNSDFQSLSSTWFANMCCIWQLEDFDKK